MRTVNVAAANRTWPAPFIEVTGEKKKDKAAKMATARKLWVPAINHHGGIGRWAFLEITDPWDAKNILRTALGSGMIS